MPEQALWSIRNGECWLEQPALLRTGELSNLLLFFLHLFRQVSFFLFKVSCRFN